MRLQESELYREDLRRAVATVDLSSLSGRTVLITGSTGLIGAELTDMLLEYNQVYGKHIKVVATVHHYSNYGGQHLSNPDFQAVEYDANEPVSFPFKADYIIHAANVATPKAYVEYPAETMMTCINGTYHILNYAKACGAEKVVFISSSEVYGIRNDHGASREEGYGYIDILNVRSSYSMGKRAAETLCVSFAQQYGTAVSIVRPGHIYGPTARPDDGRVSSAFAYQAARKKNLEMKSSGSQLRSYCYAADCASAILTVLLKGKNCEAYNISNKDSIITIREMAEFYADAAQVKLNITLPEGYEKAAFNPMDNSSLESGKLEALGWKAVFSAEEGLRHTVSILRECMKE